MIHDYGKKIDLCLTIVSFNGGDLVEYDEILRLFAVDANDSVDHSSSNLRELLEICKQISNVLEKNETCRWVSAPTIDFRLDLNAISSTKTAI